VATLLGFDVEADRKNVMIINNYFSRKTRGFIMQELTSKEIEIYNNLPFKIRQVLAEDLDRLIWRKSDYGMGYKLEFPCRTMSHWSQKNFQHIDPWITTTTAPYSVGTNISNTTHSSGSHYEFPRLTEENNADKWGIPYFADDIIEVAEDLAVTFLNMVIEREDEAATYAVENDGMFAFSVSGEYQMIGKLTLEEEVYELVCDPGDTFRTLALMVIEKVGEYLTDNHKPSITDLSDVVNIVKDEDGQRAVVLKNNYMAHRLLNHYPHCLFTNEDGETINFIEGLFRVYAEVKETNPYLDLSSIQTTINQLKKQYITPPTYYAPKLTDNLDLPISIGVSDNTSTTAIGQSMNPCNEISLGSPTSMDVFKNAFKNQLISKSTLYKAMGLSEDDNTI
jgi:hypothetical protein